MDDSSTSAASERERKTRASRLLVFFSHQAVKTFSPASSRALAPAPAPVRMAGKRKAEDEEDDYVVDELNGRIRQVSCHA